MPEEGRRTPPGGPRVLRVCSVYEAPPGSLAETTLLDPVGGMQTHTGALTRALAARGVTQDVVTAFRPGGPRLERPDERIAVHRVGVRLRRLRQLYSVPALPLALRLARGASLVHVHHAEDLAALPIGLAAARRAAIPLVVTLHTSLAHTLRVVDARTALLRSAGGPLERAVTRGADAVIVLTRRVARLVAAAGVDRDRVAVVPSGVESRLFESPADDPFPYLRRPRVLFLGRLAAQKDVGTLLRAVPELGVEAHVVVAGDGPERGALAGEAARLARDGRVTFTGFVERRSVPGLLGHADVLVLPSAYEELGSVLVEAMWAGLPVVASRTGGTPEVVEDGATGLLVPPGDSHAVARAVRAILSDPAFAQRLRAGALARARAYDWGALAARVERVYERVLAASAA